MHVKRKEDESTRYELTEEKIVHSLWKRKNKDETSGEDGERNKSRELFQEKES